MSIIEVDKRPPLKVGKSKHKQTWQQRFRKSIYRNNYARTIPNTEFDDPILEDNKSQGIVTLINLIKQSKAVTQYLQRRQFYDPQSLQSYYSPYSIFIPLEDQSYMKDEVNNTFPYIGHLVDTGKRIETQNYYEDISSFFDKKKGLEYVQQQWKKVKSKYICELDTIDAVTLFVQLTRKNSSIIDQLYRKYSKSCLKEVFFFRITRTSMYFRALVKMNKNFKVSIEVGTEINYMTLPITMKTWYCALCMCYDCEKHRLEPKALEYNLQYISYKNKKSDPQHIQNIIKILKFYDQLKSDNRMVQQSSPIIDTCSQSCYLKLTKMEIPKLIKGRHMLISPLAKSLLKFGVQMFSYNPCQIHQLFQSKYDTKNINCNLIFIHFAQQCNLTQLIQIKMNNSQVQYLENQNSKTIDCPLIIPSRPYKPKRTTYRQKRSKNRNPQFAVCMHNFVDHQIVDPNCSECVCRKRGFCLPSCLCSPNCEIPRKYCVCNEADTCQAEKCICFLNRLQCQPGVCGNCFEGKNQKKKNNCCNDQILRGRYRKIAIGISQIPGAGLGAFAAQRYKKDDLVIKYSGQHISVDIDQIRQAMIKDLSFYNFDSPNGKAIQASIDARFMGNKARFINHGNEEQSNLRSETIMSNGTQYIAIFANREIQEGEELKFNYDGNGVLYYQHRDKYPFIKKPPKENN